MKCFWLLILTSMITVVFIACSEKTVTPEVIIIDNSLENDDKTTVDSTADATVDTVEKDSDACVYVKDGDNVSYVCHGDLIGQYERVSCDSVIYDTKKEFCYDGGIFPLCNGFNYDMNKFFCDRDSLVPRCGGRVFSLDSQFCHNGVVFLLQNGKKYDADKFFWDGDSLRPLCGGFQYDLKKEFCHKNFVFELNHDTTYNADSVFSYKDSLIVLCGGVPYDPDSSFCSRDIVFERNHGETYDTDKFFSYKDSLINLCGNSPYDLTAEFCQDGKVQSLCDGNLYSQDYYCYKGSFYRRCGGNSYDQQTEFCQYEQVFSKCDGEVFRTNIRFCADGKIHDKCGGVEYDLSKKFCSDGKLFDLCEGEEYDPSKKQCFEDRLYDYFTDERDGQTYRYAEIGNYIWMTQNLNYAYKEPTSSLDSSSFCYDGEASACDEYGRLYLWSAAVDSAAIFSSEGKGCGDGEKCFAVENPVRVRGVCPEGWYLPHFEEAYNIYQNLMMDVISRNIFSIEYVGFYSSEDDVFWGGGAVFSIWFSAEDEDEMPYSYVYSKELGKEEYGLKIDSKSSARLVRCVKDE